MIKILVISAEAKEELHASVYDKTIDTLIDKILDLIFEEGCENNEKNKRNR